MRILFLMVFLTTVFVGCVSTSGNGNVGQIQSFPIPQVEAEWIRNGEPIEFEEGFWFPSDETESFLDSEMFLLGEYRGVQYFIEKQDVRPYNRLYTKFARNKYRAFILGEKP